VNNNRKYRLMIGVAAVLISMAAITTGCPPPTPETGVISDVVMSKGVDDNSLPINPTTIFSENDIGLYCSFFVSGFPVGAKLEVKWLYRGGDVATENVTGQDYVAETQTATITKKGGGRTYTVYSSQGVKDYKWPKGNYMVVISVDGLEKATTEFRIE
jgi:hypothetical protein